MSVISMCRDLQARARTCVQCTRTDTQFLINTHTQPDQNQNILYSVNPHRFPGSDAVEPLGGAVDVFSLKDLNDDEQRKSAFL